MGDCDPLEKETSCPIASTRYRAPGSATNPAATWNQPGFNDSGWSAGPSGLGHGLSTPGITVRHVFKNGDLYGGLADVDALLALPPGSPGILSETTVVAQVVNDLGEGAEGRFGNNAVLPGGSGGHHAMQATGFVEIPVSGHYTFGLNSDDGGRIRIDGTNLMTDDSHHGPEDHFGNRFLAAGIHSFEAVRFEGDGGDCMEFSAAPGQLTSWEAAVFRLVGDTANGGLATAPRKFLCIRVTWVP